MCSHLNTYAHQVILLAKTLLGMYNGGLGLQHREEGYTSDEDVTHYVFQDVFSV